MCVYKFKRTEKNTIMIESCVVLTFPGGGVVCVPTSDHGVTTGLDSEGGLGV